MDGKKSTQVRAEVGAGVPGARPGAAVAGLGAGSGRAEACSGSIAAMFAKFAAIAACLAERTQVIC